jgi:hypothetical protein
MTFLYAKNVQMLTNILLNIFLTLTNKRYALWIIFLEDTISFGRAKNSDLQYL